MIKFDNCLRCGSENIDKLKVNARINMNYPEQRAFGVISQRVIEATDALVCKDCGHIEFFIDWNNEKILFRVTAENLKFSAVT